MPRTRGPRRIADRNWVGSTSIPPTTSFASDEHIAIGWGRDYGDICPIQGVFVGGGDHTMGVSVDVVPVVDGAVTARANRNHSHNCDFTPIARGKQVVLLADK